MMSALTSSVKMERPSNLELGGVGKQKNRGVSFNEASISSSRRINKPGSATPSSAAKKFRFEPEFRSRRKRTHSWSFSWDHMNNKRRRASIILPSKFLLGGNITDPLNLEALDKGEIANVDETNPNGHLKRGGGTVKVIIPPNINDPLNLDACSEDGDELLADAILKQRRRRKPRKRKRRNSEPTVTSCKTDQTDLEGRLSTSWEEDVDKLLRDSKETPLSKSFKEKSVLSRFTAHIYGRQMSEPPLPNCRVPGESVEQITKKIDCESQVEPQTMKHPPVIRTNVVKKIRTKGDDKIVSPVIPQPGVERKRHLSHQRHHTHHIDKPPNINIQPRNMNVQPPKNYNPKNFKFQYGNYNQYYGYRNPEQKVDPRLKYMKVEWFEGKDILDIGCNIGHITLSVARDFRPRRVIGMDIDKKLINIAKKNIKHYIHINSSEESEFPKSMRLLYGPLKPPVNKDGWPLFPHNVSFYQGNYVLENEALLETIREEFDVVLCLSVTKWIHLNWGDGGLKRFFKRIYRNLRPEGILILEPQAWPSYTKKRKVAPDVFENYKNIKLYPDKFGEYLTREVGFTFAKKVVFANHYSKGFQRPIYVYRKDKVVENLELKEDTVGSRSTLLIPILGGNESQTSLIPSEEIECGKDLKSVNFGEHVMCTSTPSKFIPDESRGTKRLLTVGDSPEVNDDITGNTVINRTKWDQCGHKKIKLDICGNESQYSAISPSDEKFNEDEIENLIKSLKEKDEKLESYLFKAFKDTAVLGGNIEKRRKSY